VRKDKLEVKHRTSIPVVAAVVEAVDAAVDIKGGVDVIMVVASSVAGAEGGQWECG
jgi:hypothetical protein